MVNARCPRPRIMCGGPCLFAVSVAVKEPGTVPGEDLPEKHFRDAFSLDRLPTLAFSCSLQYKRRRTSPDKGVAHVATESFTVSAPREERGRSGFNERAVSKSPHIAHSYSGDRESMRPCCAPKWSCSEFTLLHRWSSAFATQAPHYFTL